MCKAIMYAEQLQKIYTNIKKDYFDLREEETNLNNTQLDLLHIIENLDLTDNECVDIVKKVRVVREERRKVKREKELLETLWTDVQPSQESMKLEEKVIPKIKKTENSLLNWIYRYRTDYIKPKDSILTWKEAEQQNIEKKQCVALIIRPSYDFIIIG